MRRAAKVQALKSLRVRYPYHLKVLVISDKNGPFLVAWQLSGSPATITAEAPDTKLASERRKLSPLAPSFRPLRQAFDMLRSPRPRDHRGDIQERRTKACPFHFPQCLNLNRRSHTHRVGSFAVHPCRSSGSPLRANHNVCKHDQHDKMVRRQARA